MIIAITHTLMNEHIRVRSVSEVLKEQTNGSRARKQRQVSRKPLRLMASHITRQIARGNNYGKYRYNNHRAHSVHGDRDVGELEIRQTQGTGGIKYFSIIIPLQTFLCYPRPSSVCR